MRITNSLTFSNLQSNIESGLENLNTVQSQISSGKQLTTFSDDPAGASQSLALRATLADNAQYQRDAGQATSYLSASDSALSSAGDILQSARQIAVQGANSDGTAVSYSGLSSQVGAIITQLTQVANSDLHGKYLFGGTDTTKAPFSAAQVYGGNTQSVTATVGPNYQLSISQPGSTAFGPAFSALQALQGHLNDAANGVAGAAANISADITAVDAGLSAVSTARATVGAQSSEVTAVSQRLTRAATEYGDGIAKIEDVDLATAYVKLQSAQNVYQASLATTAKAFQYSLTDYLH